MVSQYQHEFENSESSDSEAAEPESYPTPLISVADVDPSKFARVWWLHDLSWFISELGSARAPSGYSKFDHVRGFSGELATAVLLDGEVNGEVYDGSTGDEGYDVTATVGGEESKIEVKTSGTESLDLMVDRETLADSDYIVRCRSFQPKHVVEIIGYVHTDLILRYMDDGGSQVWIDSQQMNPFSPVQIRPESIDDYIRS